MVTVKNLAMAAASVAALLVGLGDVKQASAFVIGFDDLGSQQDSFGAFESQGLSFSTPSDTFRLGVTCATCSQSNSLGADRLDENGEVLESSFSGAIIAQFTNNKFVTDLKFVGIAPGNTTVSAFNTSGKLLRTSTSDDAVDISGNQAETFDFSGLKVARFETNSEFGYAIDDVSFGKPVPEPSEILGTIAFGALGGGLVLKRKLKKQKLVSFDKVSN